MGSVAASFLFTPATRPDRVVKAASTEAHEVIVDLEDAVGEADKDRARAGLASLEPTRPLLVRVNGSATPPFEADVAVVASLPWLGGVVLPKVESAAEVRAARERLGPSVRVFALVESAAGVQRADEIAVSGVERLLLGAVDYLAQIGAEHSDAVLSYPRARLVVASAAAGLAAPVDTPSLDLTDAPRLRREARTARSLGFGGKMCIHPSQVPIVNETFAPTAEELDWARRVVEAADRAGGGVCTLDGRMVDAPVVARARRILGSAPRFDEPDEHARRG